MLFKFFLDKSKNLNQTKYGWKKVVNFTSQESWSRKNGIEMRSLHNEERLWQKDLSES